MPVHAASFELVEYSLALLLTLPQQVLLEQDLLQMLTPSRHSHQQHQASKTFEMYSRDPQSVAALP